MDTLNSLNVKQINEEIVIRESPNYWPLKEEKLKPIFFTRY